MNKKLLVLAVSSALTGTTALADTVNVNVYGKFYPELAVGKTTGATTSASGLSTLTRTSGGGFGTNNDSRYAVESTNSYIGFKGDADIGGGMKGWFQLEQSVNLDTQDGAFSSRNSAAGLSGGFGNVFLGTWDSVYKQLGGPVSFIGLSSGNFVSSSNILSRVGFGSSRNTRFHERPLNYIEYDTPVIGGFQFLAGYSPDEGKTATKNADLISFGAKWESGPFYVALAHEVHNDLNSLATAAATGAVTASTAVNSKDDATRLSLAYTLGATKIGLDYATMKWTESNFTSAAAGQAESYKKKAWELTISHKIGNTEFAASYVDSGKGSCSLTGGTACSTNGLDANQINLGVLHNFNKRVGVFGLYSKLTNGESANHSNVSWVSTAPGADPQALGAGVLVKF